MSVRTITTAEGKYLHLGDMKSHLRNESFLRMFPALMKVAHDKGDSAEYIMAVVIGSALCHFSGEVPLPTIDSTGEAA